MSAETTEISARHAAPAREDVLLRVEKLGRVFDVSKPWLNRVLEREEKIFLTAAEEVSFEIARGRTFALVGESGSGKSTIAKMIVGLLRPSSGAVTVDGVDLFREGDMKGQTALRRRIQMIFQDPYASLNPRWRVGDIIAEPIRAFDLIADGEGIRRRVGELLEQVGLSAIDGVKYPHEFSGGQRQRICIARALAMEPEVLIADEAVSALDVSVQAQVLALLDEVRERFHLAMLFITHDLRVAAQVCDQVAVMYRGEVVEYGAAREIFSTPRHDYTRALFQAAPGRSWEFGRFEPRPC